MVKEYTTGVNIMRKNTAIMIIATTVYYAILLFLFISVFVFFHLCSFFYCISGLAAITVSWGYVIGKILTAEKVLLQKMQVMPGTDADAALSYKGSNFLKSEIIYGICALIIACVLFLSAAVYWSPHMIFWKNDTGCSLQFYTLSLHPASVVRIPDHRKDKSVTEIRDSAFYGMDSFKKVVLPKDLKEIHARTFEKCGGLESIELPEGVTGIGVRAFCDCSELSHVSIPSTMKSIDSFAFQRCRKLKGIVLPVGCTVSETAFKQTNTKIVYTDGANIRAKKIFYFTNEAGEKETIVIAPSWSDDCSELDHSLWFFGGDGWIELFYFPDGADYALSILQDSREYMLGESDILQVEEVSEIADSKAGDLDIHWFESRYQYKLDDGGLEDKYWTSYNAIIICDDGYIELEDFRIGQDGYLEFTPDEFLNDVSGITLLE